tara:strand:- start:177 stop:290 length:114 start_codon:yes stop_codon:yes gene_type:complete
MNTDICLKGGVLFGTTKINKPSLKSRGKENSYPLFNE